MTPQNDLCAAHAPPKSTSGHGGPFGAHGRGLEARTTPKMAGLRIATEKP